MIKCVRKSIWLWMLLAGVILNAPLAMAGDQYGYNNGFFLSSADDDFMVKMNAHFLGNWMGVINDGAGNANTNSFNVPYSRLYFSGHAFGPEWTYGMMFDLASNGAGVTALDYWVNWMHCEKMNLMVGQFKVPYGFEFLTPEYHQQFATASVLSTNPNAIAFIPGREIGVSVWGELGADKQIGYWLSATNGLANGAGINSANGANDIDFRYTGRVTWYAMGHHGMWMSDLAKSQEGQFALSVGGNWNKLNTSNTGTFNNVFGVSVDAQYAMNGMSALAEYHMLRTEFDATDTTDHAVNAQLGYFLNDNNEIAARFGWVEPDAGFRTIQPGAVWNWYLHGHNAKVQVEYDLTMLQDVPVGATTDDFTNHQALIQLQLFI